jgi:BirA family biotin operon repressor/biotin-[acetyl-CoA-carboxylase] ligase
MLGAFAVYRTFRSLTDRVRLKWVNDVLWENGKKICGILTEEKNERTVIGVGVNLNNRFFPPSIGDYATSYYIETGNELDKKVFTATIILELFDILRRQRIEGIGELLGEWEIESGILKRSVRVITSTGEFTGIVQGINRKTGALELLTEEGIIELYDGSLFFI